LDTPLGGFLGLFFSLLTLGFFSSTNFPVHASTALKKYAEKEQRSYKSLKSCAHGCHFCRTDSSDFSIYQILIKALTKLFYKKGYKRDR
jgi:hypothetical protein